MTNLLTSIINILSTAQRLAINSLIARKKNTNELLSIRSQQTEADRIFDSIKGSFGNVILSPRVAVAGEKISSVSHNRNMEEVFLDLNALYYNIDHIAKLSVVQSVSLNSEYQKSKAAVEKLINDARIFSLRKKYTDFNEIKYIDFNSSRNMSQSFPKADVSPLVRILKSKQIDSSRSHLINRGDRVTKVYTKTFASGIKGSLAKSFPPELMVDQKPETFWTTIVMADSPVSQLYEKQSRSGLTSQVQVNGPVVEIYFRFSHVERVNHIRLLPFADYPIKIIDISYKPSINSSMSFSIKEFSEVSTLDWEEYNFDSIYAHEIKITISQENYRSVIYQLPRSVVRNTDIFQRIYDAKITKLIGSELVDSDSAIELLKIVNNYESVIGSLQDIYRGNSNQSAIKTPLESYFDFTNTIVDLLKSIDPAITNESILPNTSEDRQSEELVEVRKFEYLLGMREVEIGYAIYAPISYYESDKFDTQATTSEIQLEVNESHIGHETTWESDLRKTSVEWSIDIGGGRVLPIHPRNIISDDGIPTVKDERIHFDGISGDAFTRLGGLYSAIYSLKKEGHLIPETEYTVNRQTGIIPKLRITLTGSQWYDPEGVYTVNYAVDPDSYKLQIINRFNSQEIPVPDTFTEVGPDNNILLSKFPFINYEVVNLTGFFEKQSNNDWKFIPPQKNIFSGQFKLYPTILDGVGNVLQSGSTSVGSITGLYGTMSGIAPTPLQGNADLSSTYFGAVGGVPFGYFVQIMNLTTNFEVSGFTSSTGLRLTSPPEVPLAQIQSWDSQQTGLVFSGVLTGIAAGYLIADYTLGIGVKTDDQIFALNQNIYSPVTVTVGGQPALNITDYQKFEHPAFSISTNKSQGYEYIQAGKALYFNQSPGSKEIKVSYRFISDYLKVLATLRNHQRINPDLSPSINSIILLVNNMII